MGDRTTTYYKCPKCEKGEVEEYDAPSSILFVASCDSCDYVDPRGYYEITPYEIVFCTKEEARQNGGLQICKTCNEEMMGSYIEGDSCFECNRKK